MSKQVITRSQSVSQEAVSPSIAVSSHLLSADILEKICKQQAEAIYIKQQGSLGKIDELVIKIDKLIDDTNNLNITVKKNSTDIEKLKSKCDELEQYSRRSNIRIFGIPETEKEDVGQLVIQLFTQKLGLSIALSDIDRTHRTGIKSDKVRPIIVKFVSYRVKASVLTARKLLKGTSISIKEDLTKQRYLILTSALKKYGTRNVWSNDGRIFASENGKKIVVTEKDVCVADT